MTNARRGPVPVGAPSEEEDDHDLLTYAIAADRLRDEIAREQSALSDVIGAEGVESQRAEQIRQRLEQLKRVLAQHVAARRGHVNDRDFFGETTR